MILTDTGIVGQAIACKAVVDMIIRWIEYLYLHKATHDTRDVTICMDMDTM